MINTKSKIFVAGHNGLVGSAIVRNLKKRGFKNIIIVNKKQLDLTNQKKVLRFLKIKKPDFIFIAAAKVGGIYSNLLYKADFITENLQIQTNLIHGAYINGINELIFLGSSCVYPKNCKQPMREDALLTNVLESTNEPYALAKIAGIKLCESYNRQYNTDFRSVMPTNLYGINDNFHPKNSHVIPGLLRKFHEAKINNEKEVSVWGTGKAMREFLYVDDMAQASFFVLNLDKKVYQSNTKPMLSHINIGTGKDITIRELAETIKEVVGYDGRLSFDSTKPDGISRKLIDISRISDMGWKHNINLKEGLVMTYEWYKKMIKEV